MQPRLRSTLAVAVLLAGGYAAATTLGATSTASQTVTLDVGRRSPSTAVTVTVVATQTATPVQAALSDPAQVAAVPEPRVRLALTLELRQLDSFLAPRPKLQPYRAHLWYVAHHSPWHLRARQLAAALWCTVWFPRDCAPS